MTETQSALRLRQIADQLDAWTADHASSQRGKVALQLLRAEFAAIEQDAREAADAEAAASKPYGAASGHAQVPDILGILSNIVSNIVPKPVIDGVLRETRSAASAFRAAMDEAARKAAEARKPNA